MVATATQVKAVMVPNPWEIIKDGGTIIARGLMWKITFIVCTNNRKPKISMICLISIIGFSLLETIIKTPQHKRISKKVIIQLKNILKLISELTKV